MSDSIQFTRVEKAIRLRHGGVRDGIEERFEDPFVRKSIEANKAIIDDIDSVIKKLELEILRGARKHNPDSLRILQTIPGVGDVLALTILYEIHAIARFPRVQDFISYARLVKCKQESAGKTYGTSGKKIGNAHLKWAFSEAATLFLRGNNQAQQYLAKLERKHGKAKGLSILAAKLGRTAYYMLQRKRSFDIDKFFSR